MAEATEAAAANFAEQADDFANRVTLRTAGIEAPNPEVAILGFFCLLARMIALYSASDAVAAKTAKVLGRGLPRKTASMRKLLADGVGVDVRDVIQAQAETKH